MNRLGFICTIFNIQIGISIFVCFISLVCGGDEGDEARRKNSISLLWALHEKTLSQCNNTHIEFDLSVEFFLLSRRWCGVHVYVIRHIFHIRILFVITWFLD